MSIDVSHLIKVPFYREWRGFRGAYFLDKDSEICVAKTCSACHNIKQSYEFKNDKSMKYSLSSVCQDCSITRSRAYANAPGTLPGVSAGAERMREYRKSNSSRTELEIIEDRGRIHPNGVKVCGRCRKSLSFIHFYPNICVGSGLHADCITCTSINNADRISKRFIEYWELNDIPIECYVCSSDYEHNDHVIPRIKFGPDDPSNRLPMCQHHNDSKGKLLLSEWLTRKLPGRHDEIINRVLSYGVDPGPTVGPKP